MKELTNVKVGDTVIINKRDGKLIRTISRITKTQIIITNKNIIGDLYESKYNKGGYAIGGSIWETNYLTLPKEGEIEEINNNSILRKLIYKAKQIDFEKLSVEQLTKIIEIAS